MKNEMKCWVYQSKWQIYHIFRNNKLSNNENESFEDNTHGYNYLLKY